MCFYRDRFPQMQCFYVSFCDPSSCVQKGPRVTDEFSFCCLRRHARRGIYSMNVENITVLYCYELKKCSEPCTVCDTMKCAFDWNVLRFSPSLQMYVRQWELVNLFLLSNSGVLLCFVQAFFIHTSHMLFKSVLLCPPSMFFFFISFKLIY